jgi:predicted AAA+ superfamily ATPase
MATVIRPFGFREYLRHHKQEPTGPAAHLLPSERSLIEQKLMHYLVGGGFPECQGVDRTDRISLLQSYVDTVLFRDIVERHQVSQVAALRWIIRHALRNPCGSFSVHRLHEDLRSQGYQIAKDSVHAMLDHLTDAFLISTAWVATESERQRHVNPRKVYPADVGLIEAFDASGRSNIGHAFETVVFNELERRGATVSYVKLGSEREVDFLATYPGGLTQLIQVCADPSLPETLDRELAALTEAQQVHPRATPQLIVLEASVAARTVAPGIAVVPAAEWLLDLP